MSTEGGVGLREGEVNRRLRHGTVRKTDKYA